MNKNGFSLVEVLVALAIFTIGLLGFADAQLIALRENQKTYQHALATNQKKNTAETLRVNNM